MLQYTSRWARKTVCSRSDKNGIGSKGKKTALGATVIHFANSGKYLGVMFNSKLNFKMIILERANIVTLDLYANTQQWVWLYIAVLRTIMLYRVIL